MLSQLSAQVGLLRQSFRRNDWWDPIFGNIQEKRLYVLKILLNYIIDLFEHEKSNLNQERN